MNMDYFVMDNDSGYVSHHHESNLDSSDNIDQSKMCISDNLYLNEDTLLERPSFHNMDRKSKHFDSFDFVINSSQESVKTEFSGFNESGHSNSSFVIPEAQPIICDSRGFNFVGKAGYTEWNEDKKYSSTGNLANLEEVSDISSTKCALLSHNVLTNVTNTYDKNTSQIVIKNSHIDKENIPPSATPKKLYVNLISSDVSPDLFGEEETTLNFVMKQKSPMKKDTAKESYCSKDTKLLKNVQSSLSGVHPPPSVTIIQMNVTEMLGRINANKNLFWKASSTATRQTSKSLIINDKAECIHLNWPDISKCRHHGLYYNRNKICEEFEHLCLKYAERYIGAETQSSCTVFDSNPPSSQKRKIGKPRWNVKSPGKRLSHLARRRITFSSANLQANSSSAILGSRARQILVDARRLNSLKKSPRKSPRKTPSKSPFKIRRTTPSSSAKKKLAKRFREMSGEFENTFSSSSSERSGHNFKRALFINEKETGLFGGSIEKKSTKRALFLSPLKHSPNKKSPFKLPGLDKKRKRNDSDNNNPSKYARSMSFDGQSTKSESNLSAFNRTLNDSLSAGRSEELTDQHKKKLQWAVYESLRLQNVTPTHPQYKVFASVLARVTRKFLPNLRFEGRTTEKMFRIARHHSHTVVKGKTVDEIVNDYMKNRMKNQKPQGYIGVAEFNKSKETLGDRENILQDKVNNLESIEKRREQTGFKSRFFSQNRIDRIKKVISFEEKDT